MIEKELLCICCPIGCHLNIIQDGNLELEVTGNKCEKGVEYGIEECLEPKRMVTAVVRTKSKRFPYWPVKTDKAVNKKHIKPLLNEIYKLEVCEKICCGDVIIRDFYGTGVNIVATRTMPQETKTSCRK